MIQHDINHFIITSKSEGSLRINCLKLALADSIATETTVRQTLSLESISEYKTKSSFSAASLYPSRECSSMESSSSDCTDYAVRSTTDTKDEKTLMSPGSSYLSWIESVNSEYFGSATSTAEVTDVDNKVGEWNNFWLNYNSARSRYLSSPYLSTSNEDRTGDELSDAKSTCSTQREFTEKTANEQVMLSVDEVNEIIKCSQRITEILQNGLKRAEEYDDSKNDSYYSQPYSLQLPVSCELLENIRNFLKYLDLIRDEKPGLKKLKRFMKMKSFSDPHSVPNSMKRITQFFQNSKEEIIIPRERSYSYAMDPTEIQKQKQQLLKPTPQSSSSSCINALLNTGVADILKRVITKRRDAFNQDDPPPPAPRQSFSDWSSSK
ncbi:uncharacterized protein LOC135128425 isoform X3 [Zophobas morio]|uniref:uncharacterized protein LOC135128425 isoform X3 n=1 Tax=Zophobas morio TaxID=2755281 RepID=UPI003083B5EB